MDKQNIAFFFTLCLSFILAYLVGHVFFEYGTLKANPNMKRQIFRFYSDWIRQPLNSSIKPPSPTSFPTETNQKPSVLPSPTSVKATVESLARCLADRNFVMYGTPECPSCALQREYFGDSFRFILYVDCSSEKTLCQSKSIKAYPTWEDQNGVKYKGAIPLGTLAQLSGCTAPS